MACLHIKTSNGTIRKVTTDVGMSVIMAPGEVVHGVSQNCDGEFSTTLPQTPTPMRSSLFDELQQEVGPGAGDFIKTIANPIAKFMGKEGCSSCEARRIVTNAYSKLKTKYGIIKAVSILKELWQMSINQEGSAVLAKLQEHLSD